MVAPVARVVRIPQRTRSRADEARACIILLYVSVVICTVGGGEFRGGRAYTRPCKKREHNHPRCYFRIMIVESVGWD